MPRCHVDDMIDTSKTTDLYDQLQSEVHVWYCRPSEIRDQKKLSAYERVLSKAEAERYHQFRLEKDRHNYLVSHALLRYSLSKYADVAASQWQFTNNTYGKPELATETVIPGIEFNLTHTDGLCACITSLARRCGIDAENTRRKNKLSAVAHRMFADEELARINEKNIGSQFYSYWTLREAYVKALGTGLAGSSNQFYFDIEEDGSSAVIHFKQALPENDKRWYFRLYAPTSDHVLAIAVESGHDDTVLLTELIP